MSVSNATRLAMAGLLAIAALTACQPEDGALWLKWATAIDGDTLGVAKSVCYARPAPHNRSDNYGYSY